MLFRSRQIRELILNLKEEGKTIFLTTHYIEEAERICDRIAFIVEGRIVEISTVADLMDKAVPEHTIKLTLNSNIKEIIDELQSEFQNCRIEITDNNSCLIINKERLPLFPIIKVLNNKGISVYEAKEIKPSLEDIFVKLTGKKPLLKR